MAFNYTVTQQNIPRDTVIVLERFACYGSCPTYQLTISADGMVVFEPRGYYDEDTGKEFMSGKYARSKISQDQLLKLITEFEAIKFFSLKKTYGKSFKMKSSKICPEIWTDQSTVDTFYQANGRRKKVSHYLGCRGTHLLEKLANLENKIDEIVNTAQWIELNKYPKPISTK